MTSRSRKKRLITARTFKPASHLSLWICWLAWTAISASAQQPTAPPRHSIYRAPVTGSAQPMRPVPRDGSQIIQQRRHDPQHDGWNLKWRPSANVAPAPTRSNPAAERVARASATATGSAGGASESRAGQGEVRQAAWIVQQSQTAGDWPFELPPDSDIAVSMPQSPSAASDPFSDPFGDDPIDAGQPAELSFPDQSNQPPQTIDPLLPSEDRSFNQLRAAENATAEVTQDGGGTTLGEFIQQETPRTATDDLRSGLSQAPAVPLPPASSNSDENPFNEYRDQFGNLPDNGDTEQSDRAAIMQNSRDLSPNTLSGFNCDVFRKRLASDAIENISLDISPPFRPDIFDEDDYRLKKEEFEEKQAIRPWRNTDGEQIAVGRLRDLAYEDAIIETDTGKLVELDVNRLSESDLAYISENWGLPSECRFEQVAYSRRSWQPLTMTWKASDLCHKPLYFEEVNLERYGHTAGPILQPVVSSGHFFFNIAVLPYKMGVHTPGECQYALGYYRPGNCAPWINPPVPISLRGGLSQAAVMTGAFWLIP